MKRDRRLDGSFKANFMLHKVPIGSLQAATLAAHSKTCALNRARNEILTIFIVHIYLQTKQTNILSYIIQLMRISKSLGSFFNSRQFVHYLNLRICHSLLGIYSFLVIVDTICNLKSWIWYQIKILATMFEKIPYPTSNY